MTIDCRIGAGASLRIQQMNRTSGTAISIIAPLSARGPAQAG